MDKEKFYKKLENIARETFGDFNVNLATMEPDKNGRGGNPDDIVYVLSKMQEKEDDGEWSAKELQYVIRAIKLYTEEYCHEHRIDVPKMYMRNEGRYLHIVNYNKTVDVRNIDILLAMTTFSKGRIDGPMDEIVPKFITHPIEFSCSNPALKIECVVYKDDEMSVTYKQ